MHQDHEVLVSGASFAGLSTAYWMNKLGYRVTVVEIAPFLKKGGTPVNIQEGTIGVMKRMSLLERIQENRITMQSVEFKNADDVTMRSDFPQREGEAPRGDEYEIERDVLLHLIYDAVKDDVEFIFSDSIASMKDEPAGVDVAFRGGARRSFDLVFGCDGIHSAVRSLYFGAEVEFSRFLETYFSITIVNHLLIPENTTHLYNEPGKAIMLNSYNGKTDIVLCFHAEAEVDCDYRDEIGQRAIIADQFAGVRWRAAELLAEVEKSDTFYFDKLCQIKMPTWSKGRVALVGDAAYCASPAAGRGGSLAIDGAAALADAFSVCGGDHELAFLEYDRSFRPFIEDVQAGAVEFGLEILVPLTEEAIQARNAPADL